jgi:hypothetical protein
MKKLGFVCTQATKKSWPDKKRIYLQKNRICLKKSFCVTKKTGITKAKKYKNRIYLRKKR